MNKAGLLESILKRIASFALPDTAAAPEVEVSEGQIQMPAGMEGEDPYMFKGPGSPLSEGPGGTMPKEGVAVPGAHQGMIEMLLAKKQAPLQSAAQGRLKKYTLSGDIDGLSDEDLAGIAAAAHGPGKYQIK
jgi:hypothetical protein